MKIIDSLRFVRGAIAAKELVPVLKHFQIKDGYIKAYNGVISLSAPIDCDINVQPLAATFVNAIQLCTEAVSLHLTDTGRLAVKSGTFRAFIECTVENFPDITHDGKYLTLNGKLLPTLKLLAPLMSTDASRPWSRGILLANQSAYATNNIILAEHWMGYTVPKTIGLPTMCVNELLRIDEEPTGLQTNGNLVTFYFSDNRQLTSALLRVDGWPDPNKLFQSEPKPSPINASLFEAVENLLPFTGKFLKAVWLHEDGRVTTANSEEEGAHIQLTDCRDMRGKYSADQLLRLKGIADHIDWSAYPRPCQFFGPQLRGAIIGLSE